MSNHELTPELDTPVAIPRYINGVVRLVGGVEIAGPPVANPDYKSQPNPDAIALTFIE